MTYDSHLSFGVQWENDSHLAFGFQISIDS